MLKLNCILYFKNSKKEIQRIEELKRKIEKMEGF